MLDPVDAVDAQILRDLAWNATHPLDRERGILSAWDIARGLDVHGNTVKRRVQDLEDAGVLLGMRMIADAHVFGVDVGFYGLQFADEEQCIEAERVIVGRDAPGSTTRLAGNEILYNFGVGLGNDRDAAAAADAAELGATGIRMLTNRSWGQPNPSEMERRIMELYHHDGLMRIGEVAAAVGVTQRTVRARLAALVQRDAFCWVPFIDTTQISGLIPVLFEVDTGKNLKAAQDALRLAPELSLNGPPAAPLTICHGLFPRMADVSALSARLAAVPGVHSVKPRFTVAVHWRTLPESGLSLRAPPVRNMSDVLGQSEVAEGTSA